MKRHRRKGIHHLNQPIICMAVWVHRISKKSRDQVGSVEGECRDQNSCGLYPGREGKYFCCSCSVVYSAVCSGVCPAVSDTLRPKPISRSTSSRPDRTKSSNMATCICKLFNDSAGETNIMIPSTSSNAKMIRPRMFMLLRDRCDLPCRHRSIL